MALQEWRDPKLNVMGKLFDYQMWLMVKKAGWPASTLISRADGNFNDSDYLHLDIGGEGYHDIDSILSGFNSAINVNAQENDSQAPKATIPHLVKLKAWSDTVPFPFVQGFADYMTMQGAPLTDHNVSEFTRCARSGGEIGLWIDRDNFSQNIIKLADNLKSYPEWDAWDEFQGKAGYEKATISVPGQDYMIGFSMGNNWFFIQAVSGEGKLGKETDRGSWQFDYNALATFKIRGQTYVFGWSSGNHYYFIQELLPNGKLWNETATGKFNFTYDVMKTTEIDGEMYLIGHSNYNSYLFVQELLEGGKLGRETYTETSAYYDQFIPFTRNGTTYAFTFDSSSRKWTIRKLSATGYTLTDSGSWNNAYIHTVVNVKGYPVLFGQNQSSYYWFLQPIDKDGKMGGETDNGHWKYSYPTLSTYTHGKRAFLFGQNSKGSNNWFIQEVLESGKMGNETDHENWKFAYENVEFYTRFK